MYKKIIFYSIIGEMLEGYDFIIYGLYAQILAKLFFPSMNHNMALLSTYGSFAAGFLTRPLGGIIFGLISDFFGRKRAFLLSLLIIGIPTICIGLLPTYKTIGIWAPVLLVLLRLIQGVSFGGEYTGAMIFLGEHAPISKRGLFCSFACTGTLIGTILGSLAVATTYWYHLQNMLLWGWRIPFILGGIIVIASGYFRNKLQETPAYIKYSTKQSHKASVTKIIGKMWTNKSRLALIFVICIQMAIISYLSLIFFPTYISSFLGISLHTAFLINFFNSIILVLLMPFFGHLSDKVGRKNILLASCIITIIFAYPLYYLLQTKILLLVWFIQAFMIVLTAMSMSVIPSLMIENVSTDFRASSISITYNLAIAIFGGTTPLIATFLIHTSHNLISPSYYLVVGSIMSLTALFFYKQKDKIIL